MAVHINCLVFPRRVHIGALVSTEKIATDTSPCANSVRTRAPCSTFWGYLYAAMSVGHNVSMLTDCLYFRACTLVPCPVLASLAVGSHRISGPPPIPCANSMRVRDAAMDLGHNQEKVHVSSPTYFVSYDTSALAPALHALAWAFYVG